MKKSLKKTILSLLMAIVAVSVAFGFFSLFKPKENAFAAGSWIKGNDGGGQTITAADDGYTKISGMDNYGARTNYSEALSVDGLTVYLYCTNFNGQCVGFGFSNSATGYSVQDGLFNASIRPSGGADWNFVRYLTNHDPGGTYIAYRDENLTETNFGIDNNRFYALTRTIDGATQLTQGFCVSFEKVGSVWKLTTSSVNCSFGRCNSNVCYVSSEYIPDTAYLSVWGMDGSSDLYVSFSRDGLDWLAAGGASAEVGNEGLNFSTSGWGGYTVSKAVFPVDNFVTTVKPSSFNTEGWMMVGFTKTMCSFDSNIAGEMSVANYGVYLLMEKKESAKINVQVFIFRPGTGENFYTWLAGSFDTAFDESAKEIKVRLYPDEFGRYIQIDVNGMYLMSNRLRFSLAQELFGDEMKAHFLVQAGANSGDWNITVPGINNRLLSDKLVTTPDPNNLETYTYCWHDRYTSQITVEANCEHTGNKHFVCTDCGYEWDMTLEKTEHTFGDYIAETSATCTENGVKAHYHCSVCDKDFAADRVTEIENVVIYASHSFGEFIDETPATCQSEGVLGHYHCSVCGKDYAADGVTELTDITIQQLVHDFGWVEDKPASYTETGLKHEECSLCGEKRNENTVIPMLVCLHEHLTFVEEVPAGCETAGKRAYYYCSDCKRYFEDAQGSVEIADIDAWGVIPAAGHDYQWVIDEQATIENTGLKHKECSRCGDVIEQGTVIPILECEHAAIEMIAEVPATCTENGKRAYYYCSDCGKYYEDQTGNIEIENIAAYGIIPATGHDFHWVVDSEPSYTETGIQHRECSVCGEKTDENTIIPVLVCSHDSIQKVAEKPATCTENGKREYYYCPTCGKYFEDENGYNEITDIDTWGIIPATGHNFVNGECTECGEKEKTEPVTPDKPADKNGGCFSGIDSVSAVSVGLALIAAGTFVALRKRNRG